MRVMNGRKVKLRTCKREKTLLIAVKHARLLALSQIVNLPDRGETMIHRIVKPSQPI